MSHSPAHPPFTDSPPSPAESLAALAELASGCRACPLYENATQTVFGEGPANARVVLVGEQPGDQEDLAGHPFIGPAGRLLDRALADAGLPRERCYTTNAVKHFKWEPRGKRRLHAKPNAGEIRACQPWLRTELGIIRPDYLICLGGTAARSVFDQPVKVMTERGRLQASPWSRNTLITVHPSALLRIQDEAEKREAYDEFVGDLRMVGELLRRG